MTTATAVKKNEFWIVMDAGMYGQFGKGATQNDARTAYRKAGGKGRKVRIQQFESDKPFAPFDRQATEDEADAWVGEDGSTNWVRCKRVLDLTV